MCLTFLVIQLRRCQNDLIRLFVSKTNTLTNGKYTVYILMRKKICITEFIAWFKRYLCSLAATSASVSVQHLNPTKVRFAEVCLNDSWPQSLRWAVISFQWACFQSYSFLAIRSVFICCIRPICWYFCLVLFHKTFHICHVLSKQNTHL